MLKDVSLKSPEHVWTQHVMQLLDLVLLGDVSKLLKEDLQFAAKTRTKNKQVVKIEVFIHLSQGPQLPDSRTVPVRGSFGTGLLLKNK